MSTLFLKPYTVRRRDRTLSASGIWSPGTMSTITIQGSVQPLSGKDLATMEAGSRDLGKVWVYTGSELRKRTEGSTTEADQIEFDGSIWEIIDVRPYSSGIIPHRKYLAEYRGAA